MTSPYSGYISNKVHIKTENKAFSNDSKNCLFWWKFLMKIFILSQVKEKYIYKFNTGAFVFDKKYSNIQLSEY